MSAKIPYSPYARTLLRTGRTVWGVVLVSLAFLMFVVIGTTGSGPALLLFLLSAVIGIPLLISGTNAGRRAAKFNRTDYAYSRAIEAELSSLGALPHESAFATDNSCVEVRAAIVVELERHFDQETGSSESRV